MVSNTTSLSKNVSYTNVAKSRLAQTLSLYTAVSTLAIASFSTRNRRVFSTHTLITWLKHPKIQSVEGDLPRKSFHSFSSSVWLFPPTVVATCLPLTVRSRCCLVFLLLSEALLEEVERMRVDGKLRRSSGQVSSYTPLLAPVVPLHCMLPSPLVYLSVPYHTCRSTCAAVSSLNPLPQSFLVP